MTKDPLPPIDVGTVINDRYEVLKSIGKGGMGEVFLAFDRLTQQQVALKVVPEASAMPGDDEALRQEVILAEGPLARTSAACTTSPRARGGPSS